MHSMHDSSSSYGEQQTCLCSNRAACFLRSIHSFFFLFREFQEKYNFKVRYESNLALHFHSILSIFARTVRATTSRRGQFIRSNFVFAKKRAQNKNDNLLYYKLFLTTPTSVGLVSFFADASARARSKRSLCFHCFIYCLSSFVVKFLSGVGGVLNRDLCLWSSGGVSVDGATEQANDANTACHSQRHFCSVTNKAFAHALNGSLRACISQI